jgi:SEC-C motif domain protein
MKKSISKCPCDSKEIYSTCCGKYHSGQYPLTAEELMRSRYSAYSLDITDYILSTTHPNSRDKDLAKDIQNWANQTKWTKLKIIKTQSGNPANKTGKVEFVAEYVQDEETRTHHELSRFKKYQGRWYYLDGEIF